MTNYQAIQNILRAEIDSETDNDVRATILQQLELLEAILELKYLEKKDKLNTKLQKQAQDLVSAQTQIQNQNQNQVQGQNKPKTHSEILQTGLQGKSQNIKSKTQEKQKQVEKYKEKRLVIQITQ